MSVTSATHSDYNICLLSTPSEAAEKYKSEAFKADVKAKISLVVIAVLTIVSVTLSAIKAPIFVPVILIVAGASVKTFHNKFYLKYKEEASKYTDFAKHMLGVAAKIDSYQQKNLTPSEFYHKLYEHNVDPKGIKHLQELAGIDSQKSAYPALKNLIGRVEYWSDTANQYKQEIRDLDAKIQEKATLLKEPGITVEKHRKIKSAWLLLNIDKQKIEEEKLLPAKLAAAYNLHVIADVKDKREASDFGAPEPSSYLDSVTFESLEDQPYYIFDPESKRAPLSKQWMLDASISKIAKTIFKDAAIFVA
ncbi:hypothetical protein [Simkania negevensis]|uniref:Uncharacterized protein n=1 Tax=Simkania negevensis (strain ATCC VR-1471 / DSM 27360 / Z) TaxID=331113 RepID=F8L983_SIMNZ|nr:hypothetical protein [Simkania negevensis]CCB89398.1 unknown protein [Simkania negevensis Z]